MSIFKDDDSPQQQINEQSLAQDLEKNRECKLNIIKIIIKLFYFKQHLNENYKHVDHLNNLLMLVLCHHLKHHYHFMNNVNNYKGEK